VKPKLQDLSLRRKRNFDKAAVLIFSGRDKKYAIRQERMRN